MNEKPVHYPGLIIANRESFDATVYCYACPATLKLIVMDKAQFLGEIRRRAWEQGETSRWLCPNCYKEQHDE